MQGSVSNVRIPDECRWQIVRKTANFAVGAPGSAINLFTTLGPQLIGIFGEVRSSLTAHANTASVGIAGLTTIFIAAATGNALTAGLMWAGAAPPASIVSLATVRTPIIIPGDGPGGAWTNIIVTRGAGLTGGVIDFYALWMPLDGYSTLLPA